MIDKVLEIIDKQINLFEGVEQTATNDLCRYTAGATANDFRILRRQIAELKGGDEE